MRRAVAATLVAFGLAGCISSPGGRHSGGAFVGVALPKSQNDADSFCRDDLRTDFIVPAWSELAHGMTVEQQMQGFYQKCMAIFGYEDAKLDPMPEIPASLR